MANERQREQVKAEGAKPDGPKPVKAPQPTLPKGGGAIRGIGETFATNPQTGTASFRVPIALAPGRGGFQPDLSLAYDSGSGNGPFGLGWSLAIPAITRKTDKKIPEYIDSQESDIFQLAGFEDLTPALKPDGSADVIDEPGSDYVITRYRPRVESAFARIERYTDRSTRREHWSVTTRDNVRSVYGADPGTVDSPDPTRIVDPKYAFKVFSWLLERTEDDKGNVIFYEYKSEDLEDVPNVNPELHRHKGAPFANRYIKRIRYGNTTQYDRDPEHLDAVKASCVFQVVFDYGEHDADAPTSGDTQSNTWSCRPDAFSSYRAGFEIRTYRLCRRVLVFHEFAAELGSDPCLVRSTDFAYNDGDPDAAVLVKLASVTQAGYIRDGGTYTKKTLPPLELEYSPWATDKSVKLLDQRSMEELGSGADGRARQWIDLEGEGLPGVLTEQAGALFYMRNEGGGTLAPSRLLPSRPTMTALASGATQLVDVDGDGRTELVRYDAPVAGYHERTKDDGWGPFHAFAALPNVNWNDPNLRFMDLTGDGLQDVVIVTDRSFYWYPSLGKEGFGPPRSFPRLSDEDKGPPTHVYTDHLTTYVLADMTGDGLPDVVRIMQGSVCYWPNLGHGRFGAKVQMAKAPHFEPPGLFDPRRMRLADVDGSGTADLLYFDSDGARIWRNQAGNSWSDTPEKLPSIPTATAMPSLQIVDLLGRGTSCIVWSTPAWASVHATRYVDLMGGKKPHLLSKVTNNLGAETSFTYAPSTKFYLEDRRAGRPWVTRLPFPVQVVEAVETHDAVSQTRLVSTFRYHHGHYDGDEREFRGFGMVEQEDAERFSLDVGTGLLPTMPKYEGELAQSPVLTKTWFHTGDWCDRVKISEQYKKEYYALDTQATLLPDTTLLTEPNQPALSTAELKQAHRALKGSILRQEIYGTDDETHPYSVSERSFAVRREQPAKDGKKGVFFVQPREAIEYYYERDPSDPRVTHAFTLEVDEYGTAKRSAALAYPRRTVPAGLPEQGKLAATLTENAVLHLDDRSDGYRLGIPLATKTYELEGLDDSSTILSFQAVADAAAGAIEKTYEDASAPDTGEHFKRLIESVKTRYYDSTSLSGSPPTLLDFGAADLLALPYESYQLALTPGMLAGPASPPTSAYDGKVTEAMLQEGGYLHPEQSDLDWWIPSGRQIFDEAKFYLPVEFIDPFDQSTTVAYDDYDLLVVETEDPLGSIVAVENDYRTLGPATITDPNGNRAAVRYDELGLVVATAVMGKESDSPAKGDTLDAPTTSLEYDLFRWKDQGKPNFVHTSARTEHGASPPGFQETYSYSDGSGREVMKKVQAEPGLAPERDHAGALVHDGGNLVLSQTENRWVGTGKTVLNNKGNPVKKYEPFFSSTHEYEDEDELVKWGVTPVLHYDPLGRLVRTDLPNGSYSRVTFTPWLQTSFDENDTVNEPDNLWKEARQTTASPPPSDEDQRAATVTADQQGASGTPTVTHLDPLGRAFLVVTDDGVAGPYETRSELDIEGNVLSVTDARGNIAMKTDYGVAGAKLRDESNDSGTRWTLQNVAGNVIRRFDSMGRTIATTYDAVQRPTHLHVEQDATDSLAERTVYGELHPYAAALNLRGKVFEVYDGAGVTTNTEFDFKGNLLASERRLAKVYDVQIDWSALEDETDPITIQSVADDDLESEVFTKSTTYDALNRPTSLTMPDDSEIRPTYNEASLLEAVDVRIRGAEAWMPFVTNIDYDAKGQRTSITYGTGYAANDTVTEYAYDPLTFRLASLQTTRPSDQAILQDLSYTYDPVGNVVAIKDSADQAVFFSDTVEEASGEYEYDALYRLVSATGREHPGIVGPPDHSDLVPSALPHPNDLEAMRRYGQTYEYDEVGNILRMVHTAIGSPPGSWTRRYQIDDTSNRLLSTSLPGDADEGPYSAAYTHDVHGNMLSMPHLDGIAWNFKDQISLVDKGGGGTVYFTYDASGQRVRKVWDHSAIIEERIYLGGYEIYRKREGGSPPDLVTERQTLHVMDDKRRIAMVETLTVDEGVEAETPEARIRFQLDNHLGSALLELDENGEVFSYEEYHPFGTTSFHSGASGVEVSAKRYRYTGKERDEETGLYYHGARYLAPWLGRWTAADPAGIGADGPGLYTYARDNPLRLSDPDGKKGDEPEEPESIGVASARQIGAVSSAEQKLQPEIERQRAAEARTEAARTGKPPEGTQTLNPQGRGPVFVVIAGQKTAAPRTSDPPAGSRGAVQAEAHRAREDKNFVNKANELARKLAEGGATVVVGPASEGLDRLRLMRVGSEIRPLQGVVEFGHSWNEGQAAKENAGLYLREESLPKLEAKPGAAYVDSDLKTLVDEGTIKFAPGAVVVNLGCRTAGDATPESFRLAGEEAKVTGAQTVGAVGPSDQSKAPPSGGLSYAGRGWALFTPSTRGGDVDVRRLGPLGVPSFASPTRQLLDPARLLLRK